MDSADIFREQNLEKMEDLNSLIACCGPEAVAGLTWKKTMINVPKKAEIKLWSSHTHNTNPVLTKEIFSVVTLIPYDRFN